MPKLLVQFHLQSFRNLEDLTLKSGVMFGSEDYVWVVPSARYGYISWPA
jgi:hypothetical protein